MTTLATAARTTDGIAALADTTADTLFAIHAFNDALNRHDVDAVMALMTDDCVFENTWPAPDG